MQKLKTEKNNNNLFYSTAVESSGRRLIKLLVVVQQFISLFAGFTVTSRSLQVVLPLQ